MQLEASFSKFCQGQDIIYWNNNLLPSVGLIYILCVFFIGITNYSYKAVNYLIFYYNFGMLWLQSLSINEYQFL
jgi:hypothetical protein